MMATTTWLSSESDVADRSAECDGRCGFPPDASIHDEDGRSLYLHDLAWDRGTARAAAVALEQENARLRMAANLAAAALGMLALPDGWRDLKQAQDYAARACDDHAALVPPAAL